MSLLVWPVDGLFPERTRFKTLEETPASTGCSVKLAVISILTTTSGLLPPCSALEVLSGFILN